MVQVLAKKMHLFLKMAKDSAAQVEIGITFHQQVTVNVKVSESDFVPLRDDTTMHHSLEERKLLEGT